MFPVIPLSEHLHAPTYLVVLSLTYCFCLVWLVRRAQYQDFDRNRALDLALVIMVAGFVGARLTHVFYEAPNYYIENPWQVFYVWQGGYVFFGGALLAFLASFVYLKRKGENWRLWADLLTPVVALGYALGRVGCFLNGCCYGEVCDLPWAVSFPHLGEGDPRHPTQLYATFWELTILGYLLFREKATHLKKPGTLFLTYVFLHSLGRLFMEYFRADHRGPEIFSLSVSTLISLALALVALGALVRLKRPS